MFLSMLKWLDHSVECHIYIQFRTGIIKADYISYGAVNLHYFCPMNLSQMEN